MDKTFVFIAFAVAIFGFMALLILLAALSSRRHRRELLALAQREGFSYSEQADGVAEALASFLLFKMGTTRVASGWLARGDGPGTEWVFNYRYTIGSGKNRSSHHQTVFVFPYLEVNLPSFELTPENFLHRIGQVFGYQDIDLPENPRFSSMFLLRGKDEAVIRTLFGSQLAGTLESHGRVRVEGGGSCLIFYEFSRIVQPDRIMDALGQYASLREAFLNGAQNLG